VRDLAGFLAYGPAVVFVGAGVSKKPPAYAPVWREIQDGFVRALYARLVSMNWPAGPHLFKDAGDLTGFRFRPEVFWDVVQRASTLQCVQDAFGVLSAGSPNLTHRTLRLLLAEHRLAAVVTTNFDEYIEAAAPAPLPRIAGPDGAASARAPEGGYLLKLHGTLSSPESLRFTLAHLDVLAEPLASALRQAIAGRHLLIAGYSGWDEDILPVLASAVADSAGTVVLTYPGSPAQEPIRSLADFGAEVVEADVNALVDDFARTAVDIESAPATLVDDDEAPSRTADEIYRRAVAKLPLVVNALVIARLHELAGNYKAMLNYAYLATDIIDDERYQSASAAYGQAVLNCLQAADAGLGTGSTFGAIHAQMVGLPGRHLMSSFHEADTQRAEAIARQTRPLTREEERWVEEYAESIAERENVGLPEFERSHAFWALARMYRRQGRLLDAVKSFIAAGSPDPNLVGHVALAHAYRDAGETALEAAEAADASARPELRAQAHGWTERALELALQTHEHRAAATAMLNLARLAEARPDEVSALLERAQAQVDHLDDASLAERLARFKAEYRP